MTFTAGRFEATDAWTDAEFPEIDSSEPTVVIGSISTFNGSNTAGLRVRNVRPDGFEAFIEEETSADAETSHAREAVRFVGAPAGPIKDASGATIGEAGIVKRNQPDSEHWHTIGLQHTYDDPVVLTQVMSYNGSDACHGRVQNLQTDSFEFQIEEWSTSNGSHVEEDIGYLVVETGSHELADGSPLEVSKTTTTHAWTDVTFESDFGKEPAVVSGVQTRNGGQAVVTRHRNLRSNGIGVRLQEEEARSGEHTDETVGVLATPRRDTDIGFGRVPQVTDQWQDFTFDSRVDGSPVALTAIETFNGSNPAATRLRHLSPTGAQVKIEEEASQDAEMTHKEETVSVVVVPSGPLWNQAGDHIGEAGTLTTNQPAADHWQSLEFEETYTDPVVFMRLLTYNGANPSHVRLRNVGPDACEFQIEEWDYLNGKHTEETLGYVVVESGAHSLADGAELHVGTTQSDDTWAGGVRFTPDYKNKQPALITQCQTRNGSNEVVTRTANLDANGFTVRLQEEQARDGQHTTETVGFLGVARPGRRVPEYPTQPALDTQVSDFLPSTCGFQFPNSTNFGGGYTLPQPIGPIKEIGDASNGMCGGMVFAARDYYEHGHSPWPEDLLADPPADSPMSTSVPAEDSRLFDYLSERLFDSFRPGPNTPLGAGLYQTLMNSANTKKWGQIKKSRNEVMRDHWENTIKPALDNGTLCPLGLIHVDTHGNIAKTGLNKIGENHQVLAYGYTKSGNVIEIYVYDPNHVNTPQQITFKKKSDLSNWFEPTYNGSSDPLYAFFAPDYSPKEPPTF